ncbi:oxygenase MpaB family protein [Streptomyces sp. ID05-39B]|nr:oxygenase MpaB family protein [Streptomyces sp. ID05-39B]
MPSGGGVRLLPRPARGPAPVGHAQARTAGTRGVPICQEDMIGGQMFFSLLVLDSVHRLGVHVCEEGAAACFYAWRVVGAVLGVDQDAVPGTLPEARGFLGLCMTRHIQRGGAAQTSPGAPPRTTRTSARETARHTRRTASGPAREPNSPAEDVDRIPEALAVRERATPGDMPSVPDRRSVLGDGGTACPVGACRAAHGAGSRPRGSPARVEVPRDRHG